MPQSRPPIYRAADIASAFEGRSLRPPFGLALVRTVEKHAPSLPDNHFQTEPVRAELAQTLRVPEARIRFAEYGPSLLRTLTTRPERLARAFEPPRRRGEERPPAEGGDEPGRGRFRAGRPIFGNFVAALQQPSGQWVVVRPEPEAFPNEWQARVALWLAGVFIVLAPVGYLFARRITAPLGAFARGAERLGRDPRSEPIPAGGPAELRGAADAFNEMQVRLQRYVEDRTAMVGAISHDLRTPLARIRFKIEKAPPALRDAIAVDLEHMERMIAAALSFTRDASEPRTREAVDLLSLLECVVDDAALVGADVALGEVEPVVIEADALGLQRLFANLVDNAVKYGGSARVGLKTAEGCAVVTVADRGPGLSAREIEHVFRPFYRAEPARTLDAGGIGLGLAVARSIARGHGGDVTLTSTPEGLTAEVKLPLPGLTLSRCS
ncbi:MAG: HAMP domain-containing histidine kinase [Proteobacteria bacterium]|nr:HAMP domain-containing histidine kinase [Pseudomonadota bacterium]